MRFVLALLLVAVAAFLTGYGFGAIALDVQLRSAIRALSRATDDRARSAGLIDETDAVGA